MQTKHSTTECRHDGVGIPSATRPFAVASKNKKQTKQKDSTYEDNQKHPIRGSGGHAAV
jgi:hypothetical protein